MMDDMSRYHPRNVTLTVAQGEYTVTDSTQEGDHILYRGRDHALAQHRQKSRQAVVKAALTRRSNKRTALRNAAAAEAGVTWSWLLQDLSVAEADAWLGLEGS